MPPPGSLAKVREAIATKSAGWKKIVDDKKFRKHFDGVKGEGLVKAPHGFDPAHPYIDDIKRKSFYAMHEADQALALSPALVDDVAGSFAALSPLMKFLCAALDVPY